MKRILLTLAAALAFSLPAAAASLHSWNGFYVGGQAGFAQGDTEHSFPGLATGKDDFEFDGAFAGATAGYNFQLSPNWLVGIETDFAGANNMHGSGPSSASFGCGISCRTDVDWFGTVRARAGYINGNMLYYGTAGWAYGRVRAEVSVCATSGNCGTVDTDGWVAGAGIEWAFAANWSAKLEFLHVDFRKKLYQNDPTTGCGIVSGCFVDADFSAVRVGVNYHFN